MEASDFRASLRIFHPSKAASEIVEAMPIPASIINSIGAARKTPKGTPLEGTYSRTLVVFDLPASSFTSIPAFLRAMMNEPFANNSMIENIAKTGGQVSFYISILCPENCGLSLDATLLAQLSSKHIQLDLDISPDNE